ncbi:MAG: hypothetical protein ABIN95_00565 [Mucilaginibacter sp.]
MIVTAATIITIYASRLIPLRMKFWWYFGNLLSKTAATIPQDIYTSTSTDKVNSVARMNVRMSRK